MPQPVQPRPQIAIILSEHGRTHRQHLGYRAGDILKGFVEITAAEPSSYDIKLSFEGIIRTWSGGDSNANSQSFVRTGEFKFLREVQHVDAEQQTAECAGRSRIPFQFSIPEQLISARSTVSSEFLDLAPSLSLGHAFTGNVPVRTYMQPRIMYMILADLLKSNGSTVQKVCHEELEVEVMPSKKAAPPLQIVHYPSEFQVNSQTSLRRRLLGQSIGTIHVSSWEPEAINLAVSTPKAATLASVKITLLPHRSSAVLLKPHEWEITARTWLKARTFCSTKTFVKIPTIPWLTADPFMQVHTDTTESESRKSTSLDWRSIRLSSQGSSESEEELASWTNILKIPISVSKHLVPTFLTALAARRYSLCLSLSVTGFSHRALYLEVPVQVVYDDAQGNLGVQNEDEFREQRDNDELVEILAPLNLQDRSYSSERLPEYSYSH